MDDFEIIVINDNSTDETVKVLEHFVNEPRIKVIHHTNNIGFPKTVNEGVRIAKGKYIAMLSADDYLINKNALYILSNFLDTHPEVCFVHSAQYFSDGNRNVLYSLYRKDKILNGRREFSRILMNEYWIADCAVMIRKEYYFKVGGRDENIINCCDWDLWLKLALHWDIGYVSTPLGVMRHHNNNMHTEFVRKGKAYKEILYILDKVFNKFDLTERERKLKSKAYAIAHISRGFSVYYDSVIEYRKYFYKAVKLYFLVIFRSMVISTYLKSLLGGTVLWKLRSLKKSLKSISK